MAVPRFLTGSLLAIAATTLMTGPSSAAPAAREEAVLGGGCFWCVEAALEELKGVGDVVNGYAGGTVPDPTYEQVCGKKTGHAEVVKVPYDPKVISYKQLLKAFFVVHDPTTKDRQGGDVGNQYRSVIFTQNAAQAKAAREVIAELQKAHAFAKPIVTEVQPLTHFYMAEEYHQNYFAKNPNQPYCAFVVAPKVEKLRHAFFDRLKR